MYFEEQPVHMLTASGGVFYTCYNTKRHLIQSMYCEYSNGYLSSFEFVYDEKNRLIGAKREESEKNSEGDYFMDEASFEYLEGGSKVVAHVQSFYNYKENGYQTSDWQESVFCFIAGKMISYTVEKPGLDWSWEWEYDENGNMVRQSEDMSGRISEYKYWYDEKGNEIGSEKSGQDDDWISESQYDENGNLIREEREGNGWKDITEYQYNESGKQTKCERNMERWTYDEEGNMTQHTSSEYNNIYEYNEEGKLISYAYLYSITGGDVISFDSRYLYDEQGRLSEIAVDGETAVIVSYNETGMPESIDSIVEVDNNNAVQWQLIYDLLPWDEQILEFLHYIDYRNKDIIIEYR